MAQNKTQNSKRDVSKSKLRITKRLVDVSRHTKGYVVAGEEQTVAQTLSLAKAGRFSNVYAVGNHVQARPGCRRLSDLPVKVIR